MLGGPGFRKKAEDEQTRGNKSVMFTPLCPLLQLLPFLSSYPYSFSDE